MILLLAIALCLIAILYMIYEASSLELRSINLTSSKSSEKGCRILFFSDLHVELCLVSSSKIVNLINDEASKGSLDAVVFGGDLVCKESRCSLNKARKYLLPISKACKENKIPFYGITGNHDILFSSSELESLGFSSLINQTSSIGNIVLGGVYDSGREKRIWQDTPFSRASKETLNILIAHNPDQALHLPPNDPTDIIIGGHFHGGQIKMPWRLQHRIRKDILPRKGIIDGVHEVDGRTLVISRGIGNNAIPMRFLSRPDILLITISDRKGPESP